MPTNECSGIQYLNVTDDDETNKCINAHYSCHVCVGALVSTTRIKYVNDADETVYGTIKSWKRNCPSGRRSGRASQ